MKPKWTDQEIVNLLSYIEKNNKKNVPLLHSFNDYAKVCGKQPLSIRNFYYSMIKLIKNDRTLQKKYEINLKFHNISKFEHFNLDEEIELKNKIEILKKEGLSVREACIKLSNGDMKNMLRMQNKYRNIILKEKKQTKETHSKNNTHGITKAKSLNDGNKNEIAKVYEFPSNLNVNQKKKFKLSDEEIKSLFMGLVNLVKENAKNDNQEKYEAFLQKTEEDKRRHFVELEQKQFEIDRLNQSINELKAKNISLNKCLENYRINYLNNFKPSNSVK